MEGHCDKIGVKIKVFDCVVKQFSRSFIIDERSIRVFTDLLYKQSSGILYSYIAN